MAAREGRRAEPQVYVYLVGHGLLVLGYIFFTVGFATDRWLSANNGQYGLWEFCVGQVCDVDAGEFTAWMLATRAMQTMALMCHMVGVLLALTFHCLTLSCPPPASSSPSNTPCFHGKAWILEFFTGVGCVFCLIGVSVYGGKGQNVGTLEYSYGLTVFSLFLSTAGTIMVAITRRSATTNITNTVSPQRPSGTTNTDSSFPQQTQNSAFYPHGRGQHNPGPPHSADGGYGFSENSYPYEGGSAGAFSNSPQQNIPFPMRPEGPGTPSGFGTMSMPEPGPVRGGGDDGRGGHGLPRGAPNAPARLPPISEVSPSAPPPPSPPAENGDQPPSYLEAIGHTRP